MVKARRLTFSLFGLAAIGCKPDFDDRIALIEAPRILAIRSTPAEAPPGAEVSLQALFVDPSGTRADGPLDWAFCRDRKPLTELGPISPACLVQSSPQLVPLGSGIQVKGTFFPDACRLFGPNPPVTTKGEPAGRPVDPDLTGGFYVPARLRLGEDPRGSYATGQTRLACDPGRVTPEQAREYHRLYHANENPAIEQLVLQRGAKEEIVPPARSALPLARVSPGELVTFRVSWPTCPAGESQGCAGAEPYVAFDPLTLALQTRREGIRASWYASDGLFEIAATGTTEADVNLSSAANVWSAPTSPGQVHLWIVLRDDRRGVGWETYEIDVGP